MTLFYAFRTQNRCRSQDTIWASSYAMLIHPVTCLIGPAGPLDKCGLLVGLFTLGLPWLNSHYEHVNIHDNDVLLSEIFRNIYTIVWEMFWLLLNVLSPDDVMTMTHLQHCWPFVRWIHRSPENFQLKASEIIIVLLPVWLTCWTNNQVYVNWNAVTSM